MATAYGGLQCYNKILSKRMWPIVTSYATALYRGTPVQVTTDGTIVIAAVGGSTYGLGAIIQLFNYKKDPIAYLPATTVGDAVYAGYAMVADDPDQEFVIAEDADTTQIAIANINENISLVLGSGDTTTGLSSCMLDSNTVNTTNTLQYRILALAPYVGNTVYSATLCTNPKWIVRNLYHQSNNILGI